MMHWQLHAANQGLITLGLSGTGNVQVWKRNCKKLHYGLKWLPNLMSEGITIEMEQIHLQKS